MKCNNTRKHEREVRETNKNKAKKNKQKQTKKDKLMASRDEKVGKA
jgi:hypothetical protein